MSRGSDVKHTPCTNSQAEQRSLVVVASLALLLCAISTAAMADIGENVVPGLRLENHQALADIEAIRTRGKDIAFKIDRTPVEIESEQLRSRIGLAEDFARPMLRHRPGVDEITGVASTYNPAKSGYHEGGAQTASGETYDPDGWTAAIQIGLRGAFSGVRYGRKYRPAFALVAAGGRTAILRINDVGPLVPGRVIDLNERAIRYFGDAPEKDLVSHVEVTPLAGEGWRTGPLDGGPRLGMAGNFPPGNVD